MPICHLSSRAVLAVSGEDARNFLQGLITNDVRKVTPEKAIFAALLSPQGKFLFDFFILEYEGKLLLEADKLRLPELQKRLLMYKLRAKVDIVSAPEWQVSASWGGQEVLAGATTYADPRLSDLGMRHMHTGLVLGAAEENAYAFHRIGLGVPEGAGDLIADRSLPLEYGYDELNAIDYAKGCYVGQEVTARTKHRATLHKFIHRVEAQSALPVSGTPVLAGAREAGVLCGSRGNSGLALLRVEEVERASQNAALTVSAIEIHATLPAWCKTPFN